MQSAHAGRSRRSAAAAAALATWGPSSSRLVARSRLARRTRALSGARLPHLLTGWTALITASARRDRAAVRALLDDGHDPNVPGSLDGATALLWTVRNNDLDTARDLLRAGASAVIADAHGQSALSLAILRNRPALVTLMLAADPTPLREWTEVAEAEAMSDEVAAALEPFRTARAHAVRASYGV